jgi:hypothetical protein
MGRKRPVAVFFFEAAPAEIERPPDFLAEVVE